MAERLSLHYPLKPFFLNQRFGDNKPCVRDFGLPTQTIVSGTDDLTCPPGFTKLYPKFGMDGHNGNDLASGEDRLYAAHSGVVVERQSVPARGFGIGILTHEPVKLDSFGEHYVKVRYWHLKEMYVDVGDTVVAGQLIGITDNTGYSSGNHLHFEIQPMDKDAGGHPFVANPAGGRLIAGAIDPTPFFNGDYASDIAIVTLQQRVIVLLTKLINELKKKTN